MKLTRLGINSIDVEQWMASEAVREKLDELHQKHVEESVRTYGNLDLPRNLSVAFQAASDVARRDALALTRALLEYNNQLLAMQLEQLGVDTSKIITAPHSAAH